MFRLNLKPKLVHRTAQKLRAIPVTQEPCVNIKVSHQMSTGLNGTTDSGGTANEIKPLREMPGPLSLPFVGTLYKYLPFGEYSFRKTHETGMKSFKKYGKIVHEEIVPGQSIVHLYDADDIKALFRADGKYPFRGVLPGFKKVREDRNKPIGMANLEGKEWYNYRSHVQKKMLRPLSASVYIPAQDRVAEDFVKRMAKLRNNKGEIDNYLEELYKWALESIGIVCFEKRLGTLGDELKRDSDANRFISAVHRGFDGILWTAVLWKIYEKRPYLKKFKNLYEDMDTMWEITCRNVEEVKKRIANNEPTLVPHEQSILASLLSDENIEEQDIMSIMTDIFVGGVDTTSHSLAFGLYYLAMSPECQSTLRKEIDTFAPPGTEITFKLLNDMKYLKAVTQESSRLSPIATIIPRILDHDIVLSGYKIPAGVVLRSVMSVTSRREEYFDDPDDFKPERWLKIGDESVINQHRFAWLPFGHGPRMCLGKRFADQEIWLALIKIFQRFNVEYHHEPIGSVSRLVSMPDKPLRFSFIDRT